MSDRAGTGDAEQAKSIATEAFNSSTESANGVDKTPDPDATLNSLISVNPITDIKEPTAVTATGPAALNSVGLPSARHVATQSSVVEAPPAQNVISPHPLVRRCRGNVNNIGSGEDIMSLVRLMMVQDQHRREKESQRKLEESESAKHRHENFIEMMMAMMRDNEKKRQRLVTLL